jgi:hypothetical protein
MIKAANAVASVSFGRRPISDSAQEVDPAVYSCSLSIVACTRISRLHWKADLFLPKNTRQIRSSKFARGIKNFSFSKTGTWSIIWNNCCTRASKLSYFVTSANWYYANPEIENNFLLLPRCIHGQCSTADIFVLKYSDILPGCFSNKGIMNQCGIFRNGPQTAEKCTTPSKQRIHTVPDVCFFTDKPIKRTLWP